MDKKALIKSILIVLAIICYTALGCIAVETNNPVLIGLVIGPLLLAGIVALLYEFYYIFKED